MAQVEGQKANSISIEVLQGLVAVSTRFIVCININDSPMLSMLFY